jgi:predicted small secreted protein
MEIELLKALSSGGGVVVCVAMVILFLKYVTALQESFSNQLKSINESYSQKTEASIQKMAEDFTKEHAATRLAFQTQIESITERVFDIVDKTSTAITGLEGAVRELQVQFKKDNEKPCIRRRTPIVVLGWLAKSAEKACGRTRISIRTISMALQRGQ